MASPKHVMILGGGITGLSAAFHLSRRLPRSVPITLLEAQSRLGGWLQSDRIDLESHEGRKGSVLLEAGPRTLRPNSPAMLELIKLLGMQESVITVSKQEPAARNRFIYAPPLTKLPSTILSLLSTPFSQALRPLLPAILQEPFRRYNRPSGAEDESVHSFFSRRFGEEFARRFVSALMHGIYAADSRELSIRAAFPAMWEAEEIGRGSLLLGVGRRARGRKAAGVDEQSQLGHELGNLGSRMQDVSVYSFRDGLESVSQALESFLSKQPNVTIHKKTAVLGISPDYSSVQIDADIPPEETTPSHVISALPLSRLSSALADDSLTSLSTSSAYSTVLLLNLVFPSFPHLQGFGYLVPRPPGGYQASGISGPGVLGTVFDSSALAAQDTLPGVTKMTMMCGGPYTTRFGEPYLPEFLHALSEQLGMPVPDPIYHRFVLQRDCIPVPAVGHLSRISQLKKALSEGPYAGRIDIVGAEVGGVSVGDCVKQGREAALRIAKSIEEEEYS